MAQLSWPTGMPVDRTAEPFRLADGIGLPDAIEAPAIVPHDGRHHAADPLLSTDDDMVGPGRQSSSCGYLTFHYDDATSRRPAQSSSSRTKSSSRRLPTWKCLVPTRSNPDRR